MKKCIIILLISFTSFGQGNLVTREIFGNRNTKGWNTFIGGVSSTISTSAQLATKLGISNNRIRNFVVVGSDIKCKITGGSYGFGNEPAYGYGGFWSVPTISYFYDYDGLVNTLGAQSFSNTTIAEVYTPNATSIGQGAFDQNITFYNNLKILYAPRCTSIGNTVLNNNVFRSGNLGGGKIYVDPSLQTINSGGVEGDIAYLATGNTIRYVTNFTPPNPITSLTTGTITSTSVQLNFTNPTGSTNAYDFCEIYKKDINGNWLYISEIASGDIVSGLTTGTTYDFKIVARDIFYNGTESFITASTL